MKIIIIHHRYYAASGPERYLFNVKALLEQNGHNVIPFSVKYNNNESSQYEDYFVNPPISAENFHISKTESVSLSSKYKVVKNFIYNKEAYLKLEKLIVDEKPDIVYVLQFLGKLSTSVLDVCKSYNLPVVLRLSDYNLLCSKNIFYRNGSICEKCLNYEFNSVINKCIQDSYVKSFTNFVVRKYLDFKGFQSKINAIITPSKFMKNIFIKTKKYSEHNIIHIPTFIWEDQIVKTNTEHVKQVSYCFIGRIAIDKGIMTILKAFVLLKKKGYEPKLSIYGDLSDNTYADELIHFVEQNNLSNVKFEGYFSMRELLLKIKEHTFSIIPSVWYDNMPNSLIESQSAGIPVIASKIGSLNELIENGYNGYLFETENSDSLAKVLYTIKHLSQEEINLLRKNSIHWVKNYCSHNTHYEKLIDLFNSLILR